MILYLKLNTYIRVVEEYILKLFSLSLNLNLKLLSIVSRTYLGSIDFLGIKKRGKILVIERTRRFRKGAYIYYRKQGHFARDCLEAPKNLAGNGAVLTEVEEEVGKE